MSVPRSGRIFRLVLWGATVLLLASMAPIGGAPAASAPPTAAATVASAPCPGSGIPTSYSGAVSVEGAPVSPSVADDLSLSLNYSLAVEVSNRTSGTVVSDVCQRVAESTTSGPNGSFSVTLSVPSGHCYGSECTGITGPFGPLAVAATSGPPDGYESLMTVNGTSLALAFVAELGGIALSPAGASETLSAGAPTHFTAIMTTADGQPSPLSPTLAWNLSGAGWSFVGSNTTTGVTVQSLAGAGLGQLSVAATAGVGTTRFSVGPALVTLESVATFFTSGDANRTDLDVGGSVAFVVGGTGAPAYTYTAEVAPGLGLAPLAWPCSSTPASGGIAAIACRGNITYASPGVADPTVELTNGYSAARGSLPPVTVAPLPALSISPEFPAGYVGTPLPVELRVSAGSGTPPYARACLLSTSGPLLCSTSPGPNWTFTPTYALAGTYPAVAWVIDGDGANRSTRFALTVVPRLSVDPIALSVAPNASAPTELSTHLVGGDLPLRYWWNATGASGSIATGLASDDGPLTTTWIPSAPGAVSLSLTVEDGLGTVAEVSTSVSVGPALAASLAAVEIPGAEPAVAGVPVPLVWLAEDTHGEPVPGFSAVGEVRLTGNGGAPVEGAWVNASGAGPLLETSSGSFALPTSAWNLGRLSLTVATTRVGTWEVRLIGPGLLGRSAGLGVDVVADLGHLHLFSPTVALGGARDNQTFWRVADRFGNAASGAVIDVEYSSAGTSTTQVVPVLGAGNGTTGAWVNYTAPGSAGGTLEVTDPAGTPLLGPIAIPASPEGPPPLNAPLLTLATAGPVGALGLGLTAWAHRRRRDHRGRDDGVGEDDLRGLVEGRDRVIHLVRDARALDLAGLEAAWDTKPPPPDLADWVASLVADGTLGARTGPDGVARFCLVTSADGPPLVLVDPDALDRAEAMRRALTEPSD
ncbi:MAG: hypothetical protein L3K10_04770 [Thermoplasmata archaeon]|nr:hypothetical protein [Thermoplasmata archaeon]